MVFFSAYGDLVCNMPPGIYHEVAMVRTLGVGVAPDNVHACGELVLLAFIRPSSGEGKQQLQLVESASRKFQDRVRCLVYDQRNLEAGMRRYCVSGTPSYLLFRNGGEVDRLIGLSDQDTLDAFLGEGLRFLRSREYRKR